MSTTRAGISNSQLHTFLVAVVMLTPVTHFLTSCPDHMRAQETVEVLIVVNHCGKGLVTGARLENLELLIVLLKKKPCQT